VVIPDDPVRLNAAVDALRGAGARIESITREETPLEEVFDRLTEDGRPMTEMDAESPIPSLQSPVSNPQSPTFPALAAAFIRRDWQAERSYRLAFLLGFGGIFFSVLVFYFVAQLLGEAAAPYLAVYGGDYFAFVLVGIAFQRFFGVGLTTFAGALRQAQTTGTLEAMLAAPARLSHVILASSLWSYGLTTLHVVLYLLAGALFLGVRVDGNFPAALAVLALSALVFGSIGIFSAAFVMALKRGDPVTAAVSAVSTFFGGVYFPVEVLPGWLAPLSAILPVTYALRAMRLALLQGAGWGALAGDLLVLAGFAAALLPLSLWAFRYAVRRAQVDGSLAHY
jgi:ABC-2 type transport system permease protein